MTKDADGTRKSVAVAMGVEETAPGNPLFSNSDPFVFSGREIPEVPEMTREELRQAQEDAKNQRMSRALHTLTTRPGEISSMDASVASWTVTIDRAVLAECLEQMEDTFHEMTGSMKCTACGCPREYGPLPSMEIIRNHKPDCRYVRTAAAIRRALG